MEAVDFVIEWFLNVDRSEMLFAGNVFDVSFA